MMMSFMSSPLSGVGRHFSSGRSRWSTLLHLSHTHCTARLNQTGCNASFLSTTSLFPCVHVTVLGLHQAHLSTNIEPHHAGSCCCTLCKISQLAALMKYKSVIRRMGHGGSCFCPENTLLCKLIVQLPRMLV